MALNMMKFTIYFVVLCLLGVQSVSAEEPGRSAEPGGVTFDFVNVDLTAVARFVSDITGKNFLFDERVRGKVTIIAPTELSVADAYSLFTSVLRLKGFTLVPVGVDALKIIPLAEARQAGINVVSDKPPMDESYIIRLIRFEHVSSDAALRLIQPLVSRTGHVSSFGPGNLLLVVDSGLNLEKILDIVEIIDREAATDKPEIVFLRHADAETLVEMLNKEQSRMLRGKEPVPIRGAKAVADKRLNAVVLFGKKEQKAAMKGLIVLLDVPSGDAQSSINVYFLENADAIELAEVLQGMLKSTAGAKPQAGQIASPFEFTAGITITPDKATNALIVVAAPLDYQSIARVIQQLDRRRRQVFVEALIVEASIDRLNQLGTKWRAVAQQNGLPMIVGGVGAIDASAMGTILTGLSGLAIGGLGNFLTVPITHEDGTISNLSIPGYAALFRMNEFKGAVNVLSAPQILTSSNFESEIIVGENVPFISEREQGITAGAGTVLTSVVRQDVGITLRITPRITEGDHIRLDIYQEISSVKEPPAAIAAEILTAVGPTTTKRSIRTTVSVKNNQTVVIGGLMQEKEERTVSKVPILGDIPILSLLFKQTRVSKVKTNLLVFIRPRIVDDYVEMEEITSEKQKEFAQSQNQYIEGEVMVKFRDDITEEQAKAIIADKGATIISYKKGQRLYHLKLRESVGVEEGIEEFFVSGVEYVEPNYRIRLDRRIR